MADLSLNYFVEVVKAVLPALLMNLYVVALNQLSDVESDKINKPYLPLPSGELSINTGKAIAATCFILSFAAGLRFYSPPSLLALVIYCLLGTVYSVDLPFLHWKNQPFLAGASIASVWSLLFPFGFFIHMQKYVLGKPVVFTKSLKFLVAFQFVFSSMMALFKDIPDVEGDTKFGYKSFAAHLGQEKVFWFCINVLLTAYGTAVVIGAFSPYIFNKLVIVLSHSLLGFMLVVRARSIDFTNKDSVSSAYAFIAQLFVAEFLLIPFIR
ncbi:hypothetical protein IFM89_035857 [Coptis chinensis]|uniref:Uncharacterized protein n=1 Tax=Coptis chinensis TaxID=261450 RepID=A0A835H1D6_9MAGN|nr:hypothetical protein IFM89_035857 [Coptis chinensis]